MRTNKNMHISRINLKKTAKRIFHSPVFKATGIYTFARFINASIPFFLLPILTRYLTPADYGITAIFGVIVAICNPFIGLNAQTAIGIKYFKIEKSEFPKYVSNCLLLTIVNFLLVMALFFALSQQIEKITEFPQEWLWAVMVVCFGTTITSVLLVILQSEVKPYHYGSIQFFQTVLNAGLSIWFVVWLNMNWQGRVTAQVIAIVIVAIMSSILLSKNNLLIFKYNFKYIKDAIKLGVPLIPNQIDSFLIFMADRFIIAKIVGLSEVGIYTVGFQFSLVISFIIASFQQAYSPWLFNKLNTANNQVKSKIVLLTYGYMFSLLALVIISFYFLPIIIKIFVGEKFYGAIAIIFWAILARAFWGMSVSMGNYINYTERTHMMLWINIPIALTHLIVCYLLVKENGIIGAAQANALTCFLRFLAVWVLSNKVYPMPWGSFYEKLK